ncbi:MAG: hypothetical protein JOZ02_17295 [Acidobacteria bacterium]|nr:hypothetical protein [Acidobacteriota bacterium]
MYLFLLKKALPFTLTFIFGAALSGLVGLFGHSEKRAESWSFTRTYEFGSRCHMRRHNLVAESKPLNILHVPDAVLTGVGAWKGDAEPVKVLVTFGADGRVQGVESYRDWCARGYKSQPEVLRTSVWEAAVRAARQIEFQPETVNGLPITVTQEVEIRLLSE